MHMKIQPNMPTCSLIQKYIYHLWVNCEICPSFKTFGISSQAEDTLSVYLEYVSGGSIHKLLQEYGSFKEPVIQNYTRQITSGLAYLHGRNTVHRYLGSTLLFIDLKQYELIGSSISLVILTDMFPWQGHQRGKHISRSQWRSQVGRFWHG